MFREIVIPKDNEAEFIEFALRLGFKKIYFFYDFNEYFKEKYQEKINQISKHKKIVIEIGFIVSQKNINNALKQTKLIVAKSSDKDRFFIEGKKTRLIYGFEENQKKDYLHQRASGLNHILCEIANKNNVAIGFAYSLLFKKNNQLTSLLMGRMMQNIALCQKYKVKTVIASFSQNPYEMRAYHDIFSLFKMLGMNDKRIKESLMF